MDGQPDADPRRELGTAAEGGDLSYTPATGIWRTLAPGPAPLTVEGWDSAIWTGKEMLTFGPGGTGAYNPVTNIAPP